MVEPPRLGPSAHPTQSAGLASPQKRANEYKRKKKKIKFTHRCKAGGNQIPVLPVRAHRFPKSTGTYGVGHSGPKTTHAPTTCWKASCATAKKPHRQEKRLLNCSVDILCDIGLSGRGRTHVRNLGGGGWLGHVPSLPTKDSPTVLAADRLAFPS